MSIRLWSDGHSFPAALSEPATAPQRVELLTPRTTLVPAECFSAEQAPEYLRLAGLPCRDGECVVWSEAEQGQVAVMTLDRSVREMLPPSVSFTSPLLDASARAEQTLWVARYERLLYIKVWERDLRLAEVLSIEGESDLLYYIERLGEWLPLKSYTLVTGGDEARTLKKLLKPYFK